MILLQKTIVPLDEGPADQAGGPGAARTFNFRGGCTLLLEPIEGRVEYAIGKSGGDRKPDGEEDFAKNRREAIAAFLRDRIATLGDAAMDRFPFNVPWGSRPRVEPLALLHRGTDPGE